MPDLMDILGYVGSSFDKPGRALRGLLGGRPEEGLAAIPFSDAMGLTDPSNAVSGRALLEAAGILNQKDPGAGFDMGDLAGMGTEMALDPINLLGGPLLAKLGLAGKAARKSNALREGLLASGARALPEDLAKTTKVLNEAGQPLKTFHGAPAAFEQFDKAKLDPAALFGPGIYTTDSPEIASEYATAVRQSKAPVAPNVRAQYIHAENPFVAGDVPYDTMEMASRLKGATLPQPEWMSRPNTVDRILPDLLRKPKMTGDELLEVLKGTVPENIPALMQHAGYDAIQHGGGLRAGGGKRLHQVTIAFDPSQVYDPWILPNARRVPSLTPLAAAIAGGNAARGAANVSTME